MNGHLHAPSTLPQRAENGRKDDDVLFEIYFKPGPSSVVFKPFRVPIFIKHLSIPG
jgi:hypothetical protein